MIEPALQHWAPGQWPVAADWQALVSGFFASARGRQLGASIQARLDAGACIYPPQPLRALELTPRAQVRVVILGQDPYHGPGQAEGLAFSVREGVRIPPSLANIFRELAREGLGTERRPHGSLQAWARQGVLLLNTTLTVEDGQAGSHAGLGWDVLTSAVIQAVSDGAEPVVFMLWGAHAQAVAARVDARRHLILRANHPSPLSARRAPQPFLGCGHFGLANDWLARNGRPALDWKT